MWRGGDRRGVLRQGGERLVNGGAGVWPGAVVSGTRAAVHACAQRGAGESNGEGEGEDEDEDKGEDKGEGEGEGKGESESEGEGEGEQGEGEARGDN